ncbi:MAG TPA: glycosyltransferase family 39 protein, partial [bacterium]|nr:glycosyltransferase family 39 protein [bacterium]
MAFLRKYADLFVCLGLGLFSLAIILPFLGHAFHIDEALFLRISRQIQEHPFQPYDFHYLWNSFHEPMHQIAAFPPLFPYYLAAVAWPSRFPSEWLIHLSLIPFAMAALIAIYFLCQRFGLSKIDSFLATMVIGASPAFVVSANMAMPDVAAMSLALCGLLVSIRGWKKDRLAGLVGGGLLLAAAVLMRYNAAPLVLVYLLLGLTFTPTLWKAALPSLICLGGGMAWLFISGLGGGSSHASEVLSIFAKTEGWESRLWSTGIHLTLSTFLPLLALPWLGRRKTLWAMLLIFLTLDFAIYGSSGIKRFAFFPDSLWFAAGMALLLFVGLFMATNLAKVDCLDWSKKREGEELAYELRVK